MRTFGSTIATAALGAALAVAAWPGPEARADYPTKPIRVVVPWAAGGGTDVTVRGFLDVAQEHVGQRFDVTNVTGGSGAAGWGEASRARADGYTLAALTYDLLVHGAQDGPVSHEDFVALVTISQYPQVLAVAADAPHDSFEDFIAYARERDEPLSVAMGGFGGIHHQALIAIEQATGLSFRGVPFQGGAESIAALLGGNVEATFTDVPEAKDRPDLKVLVQFAAERHPDMPEVPTAREHDMDIVFASFRSLGAPAATPEEVVEFLRTAFGETWHSERFQTWANRANIAPSFVSGADTQAMLDGMVPTIRESLARIDQ